MAEEQRIVFELRDSGGAASGTASAPSPSGSNVPGSTLAADFQGQVTQGGADRTVGKGSYSPSPTPAIPSPVPIPANPLLEAATARLEASRDRVALSTDNVTEALKSPPRVLAGLTPTDTRPKLELDATGAIDRARGYITSQTTSPPALAPTPTTAPAIGTGADPLLAVAQGIVAASPDTTAKELQAALGIQLSKAKELLDAAQPFDDLELTDRYTVESLTQGIKVSSSKDIDSLTSGVREQQDREQLDKETAIEAADKLAQANKVVVTPIKEVEPFESAADPFDLVSGITSSQTSQGVDLDAAAQLIKSAKPLTTPPVVPPTVPPDLSAIHGVMHTASAVANQFGPWGQVASTAINAAGSVASIPSIASALGPIAPAVVAAGPYIAAAAAVAAIPIATGAAVLNEAERARAIVGSFSPAAAQANAEATVRQVLANLKTADRLGDEVAGYVEGRSRLSAAGQGLRDQLSEPLLKHLDGALSGLATAAEKLNTFFENNPTVNNALGETVSEALDIGLTAGFAGWFDMLGKAGKKEAPVNNDPFTWFHSQPLPHPKNSIDTGRVPTKALLNPIPGLIP